MSHYILSAASNNSKKKKMWNCCSSGGTYENEDDAVDFFRLHPVKTKGPTDSIEVSKNENPILLCDIRIQEKVFCLPPRRSAQFNRLKPDVKFDWKRIKLSNKKINNEIICRTI